MILYLFLPTLLLLTNTALLSPTESWCTNSFLVLPIEMTSLSLALRPSTYAHLLFYIVASRLQPHHIPYVWRSWRTTFPCQVRNSVEINLPISWSYCWISKRKLYGQLLIKINPMWYILKTTSHRSCLRCWIHVFTMLQSSKVNLQGNHIFITF